MSPAPLSRIWCLFELFTSFREQIPIDMQFAPEDERSFKMALQKNGLVQIEQALLRIDAATAQASVEEDRVAILDDIQRHMSIGDFNVRVRDGLRTEYRRVSTASMVRSQHKSGPSSPSQLSGLPTQAKVLTEWKDRLQNGRIYSKKAKLHAKVACEDGILETVVNGICESRKSYVKGSFIIYGSRGSFYSMEATDFAGRYDIINPEPATDPELADFQLYSPTGKIWAQCLTETDIQKFFPLGQFVGKWGGAVKIQPGDALALPFPKGDEIYVVASRLFDRTYRADGGRASAVAGFVPSSFEATSPKNSPSNRFSSPV